MDTIRALTFDAFGTVVDTGQDALIRMSAKIVRDQRLRVDASGFLARWDHYFFGIDHNPFLTIAEATEASLARAFEEFAVAADPEPYVEMLQREWLRAKAYPEVPAVLEALKDLPRAVVSNADDAMLREILSKNGLHFNAVVTSEACRAYKPASAIFEVAIRELGVPAAAVLHVGDSLEADVGGAKKLGMAPARVTGLPSSTIETQYSNVIREPRMIGWFPSRQEGNEPRGRGDFFMPAHPSQRGGPRLSQVTVGERILVQLSWYLRFSDAFECPRETTQDGIAEALGISRAHAALELKRLKASARVEERMAHVAGGRTRRKVYFLTSSGAGAARALREHVRAKSVVLADRGDRREVLGAEAIEALKARGIREPEATQIVLKEDIV